MKATFKKYVLNFKIPSGTSRGILTQKETWYIVLSKHQKWGIGECGLLRGLSIDDVANYESILAWLCENINLAETTLFDALKNYPSIKFGLEQALISLRSKDPFELFPSDFTRKQMPIPINGLVWMGNEESMLDQLGQKISEGFTCVKMKIGAIDFKAEVALLEKVRNQFTQRQIELRLDANGAFTPQEALEKLGILSALGIHSVEQPIKPGQYAAMANLCKVSPIPIALDEELIGVADLAAKQELLQTLRPKYIILKPSLLGGIKSCQEWIENAEMLKIGWWVTSALESNIGLNAIAQFAYTLNNPMPQGLGTGSLYTNNLASPLTVEKGTLYYAHDKKWNDTLISELCI